MQNWTVLVFMHGHQVHKYERPFDRQPVEGQQIPDIPNVGEISTTDAIFVVTDIFPLGMKVKVAPAK